MFKSEELEPKIYQVVGTTFAPNNGTTPADCLAPAQGLGVSQRVTDELDLVGVDLRLYAKSQGSAPYPLRVVLFQWNDDSAAGVAGPYVLDYHGTTNAAVSAFTFESTRAGKLNILVDELLAVSATDGAALVRRVPLSARVRFNPATTTGTGKIYLLLVTNIVGTTAVYVDYDVRVYYTDQ